MSPASRPVPPGRPPVVKRWTFMPVNEVRPLLWLPVLGILVVIDYLSGPHFQFPAVYILPVFLASWLSGLTAGLILAVVLPATRLAFMFVLWGQPWDGPTIVATAVTRIGVFVVMAMMAARLAAHERALGREVEVLRTLLHSCSYCRKIEADDEQWVSIETFMATRKDEFVTGICPSCAQANFPEHFPPPIRPA